jgi:hypothetical protein
VGRQPDAVPGIRLCMHKWCHANTRALFDTHLGEVLPMDVAAKTVVKDGVGRIANDDRSNRNVPQRVRGIVAPFALEDSRRCCKPALEAHCLCQQWSVTGATRHVGCRVRYNNFQYHPGQCNAGNQNRKAASSEHVQM